MMTDDEFGRASDEEIRAELHRLVDCAVDATDTQFTALKAAMGVGEAVTMPLHVRVSMVYSDLRAAACELWPDEMHGITAYYAELAELGEELGRRSIAARDEYRATHPTPNS